MTFCLLMRVVWISIKNLKLEKKSNCWKKWQLPICEFCLSNFVAAFTSLNHIFDCSCIRVTPSYEVTLLLSIKFRKKCLKKLFIYYVMVIWHVVIEPSLWSVGLRLFNHPSGHLASGYLTTLLVIWPPVI